MKDKPISESNEKPKLVFKICLNLLSIPKRDDSPLLNLKYRIAPDENAYQIINASVTELLELNKVSAQPRESRKMSGAAIEYQPGLNWTDCDPNFFTGANLDQLLDEDEMEREANGIRELHEIENGPRRRRPDSPRRRRDRSLQDVRVIDANRKVRAEERRRRGHQVAESTTLPFPLTDRERQNAGIREENEMVFDELGPFLPPPLNPQLNPKPQLPEYPSQRVETEARLRPTERTTAKDEAEDAAES